MSSKSLSRERERDHVARLTLYFRLITLSTLLIRFLFFTRFSFLARGFPLLESLFVMENYKCDIRIKGKEELDLFTFQIFFTLQLEFI